MEMQIYLSEDDTRLTGCYSSVLAFYQKLSPAEQNIEAIHGPSLL